MPNSRRSGRPCRTRWAGCWPAAPSIRGCVVPGHGDASGNEALVAARSPDWSMPGAAFMALRNRSVRRRRRSASRPSGRGLTEDFPSGRRIRAARSPPRSVKPLTLNSRSPSTTNPWLRRARATRRSVPGGRLLVDDVLAYHRTALAVLPQPAVDRFKSRARVPGCATGPGVSSPSSAAPSPTRPLTRPRHDLDRVPGLRNCFAGYRPSGRWKDERGRRYLPPPVRLGHMGGAVGTVATASSASDSAQHLVMQGVERLGACSPRRWSHHRTRSSPVVLDLSRDRGAISAQARFQLVCSPMTFV